MEKLREVLENLDFECLGKRQEEAIRETIGCLDEGRLRVASPSEEGWLTHRWIKNAILGFFRVSPMEELEVGPFSYRDRVPLKRRYPGVRVVPPAVARLGSYLEPGVVMMPSYVNIGAYVGARTMIDTWATVGSCAQIGSDVHLSGGVGIGGVLEPSGATPVVVEDGAFIGSRCILVEGVRVRKGAVLAANVTLTASTPIIDTRTTPFCTSKGVVPERAVVVPGTRDKKLKGGTISLGCAYIIGERKASTDLKTSLNDVLRDHEISV